MSSFATMPSTANESAKPSVMGGAPTQVAMLVAVAIAAFVSGLRNPLLWDDASIVVNRLSSAGCAGVAALWQTPYWGSYGPADTYRPLGLSVMYLERLAFGLDPLGYHCIGIALHSLVCLSAWWVLSRLTGPSVGFVGSLLFGFHPVHAEAVGMAYGQLELLAALFTLLGIGLYDLATRERFRPVPYAFAVLCAAAAVCSKESGAMLPVLLMVVRAYRGSGRMSLRSAAAAVAQGFPLDVIFWVVVCCYLYARYHALGTLAPADDATVALDYPLVVRIKLLVVSAGEAVRLCVFPTGQTVYYGHLRDSLFGWPVAEATWLVGAAFAVRLLCDLLGRRIVLLSVAWFCVTFFPLSNVIPSGVVAAERTLYLPSLGVCVLAAAALHRMLDRRKAVAVVSVLTIVGVLEGNRVVRKWRDDLTLWRSTVAAHPRSPQGQLLLGHALLSRWQARPDQPVPPAELAEADDAFRAARELNPTLTDALGGSGMVALRRGDRAAAEQFFLQALAKNPQDPIAQSGLKLVRDSPSRN